MKMESTLLDDLQTMWGSGGFGKRFLGLTKRASLCDGDKFNNWRVIKGDVRGNYAARRQRAIKQER
jgi:hypothetical protein